MTKTVLKSIRMILRSKATELASGQAAVDASRLREVNEALRRVGKGTYGICIDCGVAIAPNVLAAEPWVAYCLHCQEATVVERSKAVRWFDSDMFATVWRFLGTGHHRPKGELCSIP